MADFCTPAALTPNECHYTLCFVENDGQVLMLHREKEPNLGMWNGLGGHIEKGETPLEACRREVEEESGLKLSQFRYGGILSWESWYFPPGGIYLFTACTGEWMFQSSDEGELKWFPADLVMTSKQVVENIHYFLPSLIGEEQPLRWHCWFDQKRMLKIQSFPLPDWAAETQVGSLRFGGSSAILGDSDQ